MERKKLTRSTPTTTVSVSTEEVVRELNKTTIEAETNIKRDVKRINMDMPNDLYDLIEQEIAETGQTVKGFFVSLTRQHFRTQGKIWFIYSKFQKKQAASKYQLTFWSSLFCEYEQLRLITLNSKSV